MFSFVKLDRSLILKYLTRVTVLFPWFQITPPFKPKVLNETDTRNFDIEFTGESVELTPPDDDGPSGFTSIDEQPEDAAADAAAQFSQFSYQDPGSVLTSTSSLHSRTSLPILSEYPASQPSPPLAYQPH